MAKRNAPQQSTCHRQSVVCQLQRRNMFREVSEDDLFKKQFGDLVLHGAMGVDKFKEIDGVMEHQLRFITNLVPLNWYMRKVDGDSKLFPQASFLNMMVLGEDEIAWLDGEDL